MVAGLDSCLLFGSIVWDTCHWMWNIGMRGGVYDSLDQDKHALMNGMRSMVTQGFTLL